ERPRISDIPTYNAAQSVNCTPRPRRRSRKDEISTAFKQPTPYGSSSSKQDTIYHGNSSLLTSDMLKLKGKMVTRQSLQRMNLTQQHQRQVDKNLPRHGIVVISKDYIHHGDLIFLCESCGALLWYAETLRRTTDALDESYLIFCSRGKVKLGTELKQPPKLLKDLITNKHNKSPSFIENISRYNSMFAFTSMGGQVDDTVNYGRGPFCYRIHGENYHRVGSLLPQIVNLLVKDFRMAGERIKSSNDHRLKLRLIATRNRDGRQYNLLTTSEVATLIVGDFDSTKNKRDIILLQQDGDIKRISELHPSYLAMH
nr:hypothetical protein [Tanacetum cinerariifolium]